MVSKTNLKNYRTKLQYWRKKETFLRKTLVVELETLIINNVNSGQVVGDTIEALDNSLLSKLFYSYGCVSYVYNYIPISV